MRSYRSLALIVLVVSTLQLGTAVSMYGLFVFRHLDEMKARGASAMVTRFVFAASEGIGASFGFFACICIIFLQLFMLAIWRYTKTSQEQSDDEIREKKLFAADMQAHAGYGGTGPAVAAGRAGPLRARRRRAAAVGSAAHQFRKRRRCPGVAAGRRRRAAAVGPAARFRKRRRGAARRDVGPERLREPAPGDAAGADLHARRAEQRGVNPEPCPALPARSRGGTWRKR